ncbi:RCC1-like domain-containing protein [Nocardioides flavescens]
MVAIAAGGAHTLGVGADGCVLAAGRNDHGQCDVGQWSLRSISTPG